MARTTDPNEEPGRIKQMWQVFQMTRRYDSMAIWYLLAGFLLPVFAGIGLGVALAPGSVIGLVLYIIAGVMGGLLLFLVILGRRAERAAYSQIEGQAGAVGAVLKNSLRGGWVASEMPTTVSPKSQDAVYRAVGRGGIVLIGEGPQSRTQRMLEDERRSIARVVGDVPINFVFVGPDPQSVPLHKLARELRKFKPVLRKQEILAVSNRLSSLSKGKGGLPIPKGVDPFKARAPRPR
jgi:hypothetical protein